VLLVLVLVFVGIFAAGLVVIVCAHLDLPVSPTFSACRQH
jgi:hypothetical protein